MESQLIAFFKSFAAVTDADITAITEHFEHRFYKEGDDLLKAGKVCREMFFICTGVLRIYSINEKAAELTHYFFRENQLCTVLQSFNEETPSPSYIQACTDVTVLSITKTKLLALYQKLPFVKDIIDQRTQLQLIEKVNVRNAFVGEDAEGRYNLFVKQNPDVAARVALKAIASYLGITPQSLSRIRKQNH